MMNTIMGKTAEDIVPDDFTRMVSHRRSLGRKLAFPRVLYPGILMAS